MTSNLEMEQVYSYSMGPKNTGSNNNNIESNEANNQQHIKAALVVMLCSFDMTHEQQNWELFDC